MKNRTGSNANRSAFKPEPKNVGLETSQAPGANKADELRTKKKGPLPSHREADDSHLLSSERNHLAPRGSHRRDASRLSDHSPAVMDRVFKQIGHAADPRAQAYR